MINTLVTEFKDTFAQTSSQLLYTEAGIAAALAIGAIVIGWLVSRMVAPKLADIWEKRAGYESDLARRRIKNIIRRTIEAILIAIILAAWNWTLIANVILAVTLSISTGLLVNDFIRAVRMPNWIAILSGGAVTLIILFNFVGSIDEITLALDRVGFNLGEGDDADRISLLKIATVILTGILLFGVVRVISRIISHSINNADKLDNTQKLLAQKIATIVIIVIAFFIGIDILGIDLTALAFFGGAFGLAIGFGMQKTIGNLIAGILLLMDRSIKPGDVIVVGDSFGWVNKIGVRAVSVITRDGKEHLIPNENLMINEVENWSYSSRNVRVRIPVGVSYNSDMDLVEKLLLEAAMESPRILKTPRPNVWMLEFGDNSVNFEILGWIRDPEEGVGNFRSDVLKRVWRLFKENDIEIPFPQRDVHIKGLPDHLGKYVDDDRRAIKQADEAENSES